MLGLTPKQKECLDFIRAYIEERGASPSYDEIKGGMGLRSKSGVHRMVHGLVERGHLVIEASHARTIQLHYPLPFDLPDDISRAVRDRAAREGVSPVVVIRDAVAAYVGAGA